VSAEGGDSASPSSLATPKRTTANAGTGQLPLEQMPQEWDGYPALLAIGYQLSADSCGGMTRCADFPIVLSKRNQQNF
jgi:hypothetical protein